MRQTKHLDVQDWFQTPCGQQILAWEQSVLQKWLEPIFGFHALQLGLGFIDLLEPTRISQHWVLDQQAPASVIADFAALPFANQSIDLVVLPHTFQFCNDPHACLREVQRVLIANGKVIIIGMNPLSLYSLKHQCARLWGDTSTLPKDWQFSMHLAQLRDWMVLLGLEIQFGVFGAYRPPLNQVKYLEKLAFLEKAGHRWWPQWGACYAILAVRKEYGMRLVGMKPSKLRSKNSKLIVATQKTT